MVQDSSLLEKARKGDRGAFEELLARERPRLEAFVRGRIIRRALNRLSPDHRSRDRQVERVHLEQRKGENMRMKGRQSGCSLLAWLGTCSRRSKMRSRLPTSVMTGLLVFGPDLLAPLERAAADAPQIEWVRYRTEEYTGCLEAGAAAPTSDGGFVFWGSKGPPPSDGVLMKVDSRGDVVWTKCSTDGLYTVRNAQLDDGGILAHFGPNPRAPVYLHKLNRSGDMEWQIPHVSILNFSFRTAQLGDGSHMFCGYTTTTTPPEGFLLRISAAGVSDPPAMIPDRWFENILRTSDGGALVLGKDPPIPGVEETVLRFHKLDTVGGIEWETSLLIGSGAGLAGAPAIQLKSGGYVVGYSNYYVRLDALGNLLSHEAMPPSDTAPLSWSELSSGDMVQVGTMTTDTGPHGYLARVSADWETRWIVDVGNSVARNVQPTSDGGYLVDAYGKAEDGSSNVARLIKLGPDPLNSSPLFIRGDANGDGAVDIADPVATLGFLFLGDTAPGCMEAANTNDDGDVDISDAVHTLNYLFVGGAPIPPPFPEKGIDPTAGAPGCARQ